MALELVQTQEQQLKMTPALFQAITLLQYNHQELTEYIEERALDNPLIELERPFDRYEQPIPSGGWDRTADSRTDILEATVSNQQNFREDLSAQVRLLSLSGAVRRTVQYLIEALNESGYLMMSESELSSMLDEDEATIDQAIDILQSLHPAGIGARGLTECLLLQLRAQGHDESLAACILQTQPEVFVNGDWEHVKNQLNVTDAALTAAIEQIRALNPTPIQDSVKEDDYIVPELTIRKNGPKYEVFLDQDDLPVIHIDNDYYQQMQKYEGATAKYINQKYQEVLSLRQAILQRKQTMSSIAQTFIHYQDAFLDYGRFYLKPMTLKSVAETIGVHESTVSRAVKHKYIQTPQGVFEFKQLFVRGGPKDSTGEATPYKIKQWIKRMIDDENTSQPYSDQKLSELLAQQQSINLSRRAVAKYRKTIGIPSSTRRKKGE
ncbi:RNA polymerase factor sigma-54 [Tuberibacillus sp. Marseille-P3662]|uniref:RNA polymerase factor sigma-54 n=1 Tax=Tuberibacillus sp. Marseille-P3662 TaxID=1965358 RepID=UPI000A1CAA6B|nr:RNA polymerase factor sigma-54 [Tuberibacillus sp. Marseille-P3662]